MMASSFWRSAAAIRKLLPIVARDAAGLAGAGLIAYGAWLVYAPMGYIVGGTLLLMGALGASRSRAIGG